MTTERVAYKGPGFRLRHKVEVIHTWDGVPLGFERIVDTRQRMSSWTRRTAHGKFLRRRSLVCLVNDLITHDRRVISARPQPKE